MEVRKVITLQLQNDCLFKDVCIIWPWPHRKAVTMLGEDPLAQKCPNLEEMGKTNTEDINLMRYKILS